MVPKSGKHCQKEASASPPAGGSALAASVCYRIANCLQAKCPELAKKTEQREATLFLLFSFKRRFHRPSTLQCDGDKTHSQSETHLCQDGIN